MEEYVRNNLLKLVPDQKMAFKKVIESVNNNLGKVLFLDAPGGTGKTFLLNLIMANVRSKGKRVLAVASSGIAATLLSGERTAHSTFKLPINVYQEKETVCSIRKNGTLGKIIQKTVLIVWDECTMSHKADIEAIDRTLRDLKSCKKVMGGVTFVCAGDFRQTLPVISRGTRADIIKTCLKSSYMWNFIEKRNLRTNMERGDLEFPEKLINIGEGKIIIENGYIKIDKKIGKVVNTINELIDEVYPDIENLTEKSYNWLCERAIISPRNETAEEINNRILERIKCECREYTAIDTVINDEDVVHYPQEFLNALNPSGFPKYNLKLKVGIFL